MSMCVNACIWVSLRTLSSHAYICILYTLIETKTDISFGAVSSHFSMLGYDTNIHACRTALGTPTSLALLCAAKWGWEIWFNCGKQHGDLSSNFAHLLHVQNEQKRIHFLKMRDMAFWALEHIIRPPFEFIINTHQQKGVLGCHLILQQRAIVKNCSWGTENKNYYYFFFFRI